jgi:p-cumate 2,3-dioxygenase subunit alpha
VTDYIDDDRSMPRFRVNREAMIDPAVLAQEQRQIFDKSWLYVGHESELPKRNDFKTRTVAGRPVIFFRDAKDNIRVWMNTCPHRGAMLCREKKGNARFMTCFYHGWSFSNAGRMVSMPSDAAYGENYHRPSLAAPPRMESYRGFAFVSFDPGVVDLVTYLAGAREYLDLVCDQSPSGMQVLEGTHEYSVKANWKLLVENSVDGYHAITAHQRYFEMVMAANPDIDPSALSTMYSAELGNGHAVLIGTKPEGAGLFGRPLSEEAAAERAARFEELAAVHGQPWVDRMQGSRNLVIFPNLVVIDLVMGVVIRRIDPITPDYMEVNAWELAPPEEGPELRRQRLDNFLTFWGPGGLASPDDVEALEMCQRGFFAHAELPWSDISRGMDPGRVPLGDDELQMRQWWRRWNELMTGEPPTPEPHPPLPGNLTAPRRELAPATASLPATQEAPMSTDTVMNDEAASIGAGKQADDATLRAVERFLYADADLLDGWHLHEWLATFTADGRYIVPATDLPEGDTARDLVLVNDDRFLLEQRVNSLLTRAAHAEYPHSRTRRLVTNIQAWQVPGGAQLRVTANFAIYRMRPDVFDTYVGQYRLLLEGTAPPFKMRERRSVLDLDALRPQGKVSILL